MTKRGWGILGLGLGLWLVGRILAIDELIHVAVALAALCFAALVWIRLGKRRILAERAFSEPWVHRGGRVDLEFILRNPDRLPSPLAILTSRLPPPTGLIRVAVSPVPPMRERRVKVPFRPDRRGTYRLDPLEAVLTDPFGLARDDREFADGCTLIVYPKVETLPGLGVAITERRGERARYAPATQGEDLYGVRRYVSGDDPRKIHWKTTARTGNLMVREEEAGGREMVTVFLDDRAGSHFRDSFEWAVDAAASVVALYARFGYAVRLKQANGRGIPFGRGPSHYNRIFEELATVLPESGRSGAMERLARGGREGTLVVTAGNLEPPDVRALTRAGSGYREVVVVLPPGSSVGSAGPDRLRHSGARIVAPATGETLSEAWARSLATSV